jgi:hypothetical protein
MRTLALLAAIGAALLAGGLAYAEQWNDPNGRMEFEAPAGWRVQPRSAPNQTVVLAFNPTNDCYFFGIDNPATANSSANAARNTTAPLPPEAWVASASPLNDFFEGSPPTLVSQTVDTSGFWPVQRAELRGPSKTVYGAMLVRPGVELRVFCSGGTSAAAYDAIIGSLGHPNDAAWQTQANEQAAQQSQQATEQPQQQEPERRRRGRGFSTEQSNAQPDGM